VRVRVIERPREAAGSPKNGPSLALRVLFRRRPGDASAGGVFAGRLHRKLATNEHGAAEPQTN